MASVLSALGITGVSAPDPSAYSNIQAESLNLNEAKGDLKSTLSNIDLAISGADLIGLPPSYIASAKSLRAEADSAMNSNMSSAQLAAKNVDISKKLELAKTQQVEAVKQEQIDEYTTARDTIVARVNVINADKTTSTELTAQYNKLLEEVNKALNDTKTPPVKTEGSTDVITPPASAEDLLATLDNLDTLKDKEENKEFNWQRLLKKVLRVTMFALMIISVSIGAILGGIVMSNAYAADHFWAIKLFYFIYGAAFFPISLLYGAIKKPMWLAGLIPLKSLVPREIPASVDIPIPPVAVKSAASALLSKLPGASMFGKLTGKLTGTPAKVIPGKALPGKAKTTTPVAKAPKVSALSKLGLTRGGGDEISVEGVTADPIQEGLSLTDKLFGYILLEADDEPTPKELSSQNTLQIISIVELVVLGLVGSYYGAFAIIQKIRGKWL